MTGAELRGLRLGVGLSIRGLAARARVSPSTVARIEDGSTSPTLDTLTRLFRACGRSLHIEARAPYEPSAAAAARMLLAPSSDLPTNDDTTWWLAYYAAAGEGPGAAGRLIRTAGAMQHLDVGAQVRVRVAGATVEEVASQVAASGTSWCLTAAAAAVALGAAGAPLTVLTMRVADPTTVRAFLATPDDPADTATGTGRAELRLLPFDGVGETGRVMTGDGMWWADPLQVAIDCFGGDDTDRRYGDELVTRDLWREQP